MCKNEDKKLDKKCLRHTQTHTYTFFSQIYKTHLLNDTKGGGERDKQKSYYLQGYSQKCTETLEKASS